MTEEGNKRVDILIALFNNRADRSQYLSERQFTITASVLTLHLGILAGLIVSSPNITYTDSVVSFIAITLFNGLVIYYILTKCISYWDAHDNKDILEKELNNYIDDKSNMDGNMSKREENKAINCSNQSSSCCITWRALNRGTKGSLLFVSAIILFWFITSFYIFERAVKTHGAQKTGMVCIDNTARTITIMVR